MGQASADCGCAEHDHQDGTRAVDNSTWDGPAAMSRCANSTTPASCYRSICAGRKAGDAALQSSWALPHHKTSGGPPNAAGVRNSLSRLPQTQGLTNREEARRHLERHLAEINRSQDSPEPPREDLVRGIWPFELRDDGGDGMPTLFGHFAVFNEWTEISSLFEGRFMERLHPKAMDRTFSEDRDQMRVLFQHGRDPQVGDKPLGPIDQLEAQRKGAYYEVPMLDTSYNQDLLPGLRVHLYGASFRFQVNEENWVKKPDRSDHNPEGLPERTILDATVREFGPVTFPAYTNATAAVRSLSDLFHLHTDLTGRSDAWSVDGGDPGSRPGEGDEPHVHNHRQRVEHDTLRLLGIIR